MIVVAIFIALLLDWLIGDPYSWPHPVKLIGNFIYACLKLENLKIKISFSVWNPSVVLHGYFNSFHYLWNFVGR